MNSSSSSYNATASSAVLCNHGPGRSGHDSSGRQQSQQSDAMIIRILCVYGIFDGADMALLPASFRALEANFGFSPTRLGTLAVVQGVAMAASGPFWGALADAGFSRRRLLAGGAFMWSIVLIGLAFTTDFYTMIALRLLNGIAMGMLTPVMQSLVAEKSKPEERGQNFGWIEFFRLSVGMMFVMVFATGMSNQIIFGMHGFSVAFLVIALGGLALTPSILFVMEEEHREWRPNRLSIVSEISKLIQYWQIPTFRIIVLQGCFGSISGAALQYMVMYFQYIGISDSKSGLLAGVGVTCCGVGYLIGGFLGDRWARASPLHGRAFTAQLSVLISIPLYYVMFERLQRDASMTTSYLILVALQGLTSTWPKVGCNKPIFLEIVPKDSISSAISWEIAIEKTSGQFLGPVAVGLLADRIFGYSVATEQVANMAPDVQMANTLAMAHSLCLSTMVPSIICFCLYGLLHWTYQHDSSEAKQLEVGPALGLRIKKAEATDATALM